jgi:ribosomal protein S18 acetylase RimI-like enzyme
VRIVQAETSRDIEDAGILFAEYAKSLGFDLSFQGFDAELADLAGHYARPQNCLLLAMVEGQAVGCVAMKRFDDGICEMKRLYVHPEYRGRGIGRALAEAVIEYARQAGYQAMRLDTVLPRDAAMGLYYSMGFENIDPYRYNPMKNAAYLELRLE